MSCTRCYGAIIIESYVDAEDDGYGLRWISAWRCVHCGRPPEPDTKREGVESLPVAASSAARARRIRRKPACPLFAEHPGS